MNDTMSPETTVRSQQQKMNCATSVTRRSNAIHVYLSFEIDDDGHDHDVGDDDDETFMRVLQHKASPQQKKHEPCRSIMHYTSYLRTKDCTNNGYVTDMLEHNTMINIDTGVHMISHNTQT